MGLVGSATHSLAPPAKAAQPNSLSRKAAMCRSAKPRNGPEPDTECQPMQEMPLLAGRGRRISRASLITGCPPAAILPAAGPPARPVHAWRPPPSALASRTSRRPSSAISAALRGMPAPLSNSIVPQLSQPGRRHRRPALCGGAGTARVGCRAHGRSSLGWRPAWPKGCAKQERGLFRRVIMKPCPARVFAQDAGGFRSGGLRTADLGFGHGTLESLDTRHADHQLSVELASLKPALPDELVDLAAADAEQFVGARTGHPFHYRLEETVRECFQRLSHRLDHDDNLLNGGARECIAGDC